MAHHKFSEKSGFLMENLNFTFERGEKGEICRKLGITHFIDGEYPQLPISDTFQRYLGNIASNDSESFLFVPLSNTRDNQIRCKC
jgi:hypothetical protein